MRDCMNCVNHTKDGCKVWNCKFTTVEDAKAEFAVEELEKIKEEISMTNGCGDFIATYDIQKLIDNHISELKGENQ